MTQKVILLPAQAERIAQEAVRTGGAVGVSQSGGSTLTLHTGQETFVINAGGKNVNPPNQEQLPC